MKLALQLWLLASLIALAIAANAGPPLMPLPPLPPKGATLLLRKPVVHPLAGSYSTVTNLTVAVHIMVPFSVQSSSDLVNWTTCTNISFPDIYFQVSKSTTNLFFRGYWPNAPVQITQTNTP